LAADGDFAGQNAIPAILAKNYSNLSRKRKLARNLLHLGGDAPVFNPGKLPG